MRRTVLPSVVVLVVALTATTTAGATPAPAPGSSRSPAPPSGSPLARAATPAPASPTPQVVDDVDIGVAVPALVEAFGERYGGYWVDGSPPADTMRVAVVDATDADRSLVAEITGGHPRVATQSVAIGYDALHAAADEVAASLDPAAGNFSVGADVATNQVVVETESGDAAGTEAVAEDAATRGVHAARTEVPPERRASGAGDPVPTTAAPPSETEIDAAVVVEPRAAIDIATTNASRSSFPWYEAALSMRVYVGNTIYGCTSGLLFRNAYGYFGSTAGHCGPVNSGIVMGSKIVDWIRKNTYHSTSRVVGDVGIMSMSAHRWPAWPAVHGTGWHRSIVGKLSNTQIAGGLRLCFQGVTSGGGCGTVVRANSTMCCDSAGKTYVYSCTNSPGRPGDSGGPVYQPLGAAEARAAGMLSSTVTIDGARLMCFSTTANLELALRSQVVTAR